MQGSGLSTLYDGTGVKQSLVVTVPPASGTGKGSPTGIVYNVSSTEFQIMNWTSAFLFCDSRRHHQRLVALRTEQHADRRE